MGDLDVGKAKVKTLFSFEHADWRPFALGIINVLSIFAVWIPFIKDMTVIGRYWDGPMYQYVAATLYSIPANSPLHAYPLPDYYYACHLAFYPLLIRAFSFIGYDWSALLVVILASTAATVLFYYLLKEFNMSINPFWASVVFIFFPSRWLLYHSIGASEPVFIMLVIASLYCYKKDKYLFAFALAGMASITRIFGIIMMAGYVVTLVYQKKYRYIPLTFIIPAFIGLNFAYYWLVYNDPLAYFRYNGGYMTTTPFPMLFDNAMRGVTNHAELFFAFYILYLLGTLRLWKHKEIFFYSLLFVAAVSFVRHPDVSRYLLPAAPFALILAFDDIICRKEFMLVFPLIVIFGLFYCWGIIPTNLMDAGVYSDMLHAIGR